MPELPEACAVTQATAAGQGFGAASYTGEVETVKNKRVLHKGDRGGAVPDQDYHLYSWKRGKIKDI